STSGTAYIGLSPYAEGWSRPSRIGSCTPREARRPLLEEGGHAFRAVRGAGGNGVVARLHVQDVLERHAEPLCHGRSARSSSTTGRCVARKRLASSKLCFAASPAYPGWVRTAKPWRAPS